MNKEVVHTLDTQKIVRYFADNVLLLTGINIQHQDIHIVIRKKTLLIKVWDCTVAQVCFIDIEDAFDQFENAIVLKAVKQVGDLRAKIIKCKIEHLNRSIAFWESEVKSSLAEKKISEGFINSLKFNIVNHGYRYKEFTIKSEKLYDYPYLAIHICNEEGFNYSYAINVYNTHDPIEMEELKDNLFVAILEQSINNEKDLDTL